MPTSLKLGLLALCLTLAMPMLASPVSGPTKKLGKHHNKTIPARHNAGRPMHA